MPVIVFGVDAETGHLVVVERTAPTAGGRERHVLPDKFVAADRRFDAVRGPLPVRVRGLKNGVRPGRVGAKAIRGAPRRRDRLGAFEYWFAADARDISYMQSHLPEALRIGLCDAVWPAAELKEKVTALAGRIAANGPLAVAEVKKLVHQGQSTSLETALALEARSFGLLFGTHDQREGMKAFLEKPRRKAAFKGQ